MATAYLAVQLSLQRQVVLKVLYLQAHDKSAAMERFLNEGRIVSSLRHPHIITIYDVGTTADYAYISMEYIDGGDLKSRLDSGPFTPQEALRVIEQIASGLAVAHHSGIIHRDVKPGNILFRSDGTPILTDFGIAKQLTTDANLTSSGIFVGSPNYMAPEQAESGPIDGRADIYSLGVLLFEMLTRRKPYIADSVVDVILKHKKEPIPRLPDHLSAYQALIDLMLAKRRNDRFRDVDSLLHYIRQLPAARPAGSDAIPDDDATLEIHDHEALHSRVTRVRLAGEYRSPIRIALIVALIVSALIYAGLQIALNRINGEPDRLPVFATTDLELVAAPPAPALGGTGAAEQPDVDEVITALHWLARNSLDDYRLTSPPKDNAYYYYSRLLQVDPGNGAARAGYQEIANRFGRLAEQAIAEDDYERARSYIDVGLQIDPGNDDLSALRQLAQPQRRGLLDVVFGWFR